jgi:hypothetical protein
LQNLNKKLDKHVIMNPTETIRKIYIIITGYYTTTRTAKTKGGVEMAMPIVPTPVLWGRDAEKFEKKIAEDLKNPTTLKSTPKLEEARVLAREYAQRGKKHL